MNEEKKKIKEIEEKPVTKIKREIITKTKRSIIKTKSKNIALFLLSQSGTLKVIGSKKFNPTRKKVISYKNGTFTLTYEKSCFEWKGKNYYLFDFNNTGQLLLNETSEKQLMTIEVMDFICNQHVITDLLKASEQKLSWSQIITYLLAGLGIGAFAGLWLGLSGVI